MRFCLLLISLLLGACSAMPPAFEIEGIREVSYAQVSENTQSYKDTLVQWGGVIINVNHEQNASLMQVMFYPLDYYGRPEIDKPSAGYFIVKSSETLDPENYAASREVVVVGSVAGKTEVSASYGNTSLPLIEATAIHLWPIAYRDNYYRYCPTCYFRQLFW